MQKHCIAICNLIISFVASRLAITYELHRHAGSYIKNEVPNGVINDIVHGD